MVCLFNLPEKAKIENIFREINDLQIETILDTSILKNEKNLDQTRNILNETVISICENSIKEKAIIIFAPQIIYLALV